MNSVGGPDVIRVDFEDHKPPMQAKLPDYLFYQDDLHVCKLAERIRRVFSEEPNQVLRVARILSGRDNIVKKDIDKLTTGALRGDQCTVFVTGPKRGKGGEYALVSSPLGRVDFRISYLEPNRSLETDMIPEDLSVKLRQKDGWFLVDPQLLGIRKPKEGESVLIHTRDGSVDIVHDTYHLNPEATDWKSARTYVFVKTYDGGRALLVTVPVNLYELVYKKKSSTAVFIKPDGFGRPVTQKIMIRPEDGVFVFQESRAGLINPDDTSIGIEAVRAIVFAGA